MNPTTNLITHITNEYNNDLNWFKFGEYTVLVGGFTPKFADVLEGKGLMRKFSDKFEKKFLKLFKLESAKMTTLIIPFNYLLPAKYKDTGKQIKMVMFEFKNLKNTPHQPIVFDDTGNHADNIHIITAAYFSKKMHDIKKVIGRSVTDNELINRSKTVGEEIIKKMSNEMLMCLIQEN